MQNPRDITGKSEEVEWITPDINQGTQKKNKKKNGEPRDIAGNAEQPQRYHWELRRKRRTVDPTDIAGNADEEEW